jgi:hypothetical protein
MDESTRSDAILALGRKLVEELGLEPSVDTFGRWIAHYIADLMFQAENATDEGKLTAHKNCFDAILTLWSHRAELPNGKRPFEELEPIVRAVESLDPDRSTPRYFLPIRSLKRNDEHKTETETWLDMVSGIDLSARILIGHCLAQAASAATDKSQEWIKLAEAAGAEDGVSEISIRFISSIDDLNEKPNLNAEERKKLEDRLVKLEAFDQLSKTISGHWRAQLEVLRFSKDASDVCE